MASTNPFPHANSNAAGIDDGASTLTGGRAARRASQREKKSGRKRSVNSAAPQSGSQSRPFDGWPSFESLKPALVFLCFPVFIVLVVVLAGGLPKPILYLCGSIIGIVVAMSTFKTAELTVVCILLYLPFAKSFVIPILPGLNGTNMLIMLGLGTAFLQVSRDKVKFIVWPPGSGLVIAFGVYTALSAITILQHSGGAFLLKTEILSYKSWLDQFVIYAILVSLVRDKDSAKRVVVYLMIGSMAVVIYAIPELLEKMGRSSIEKSRIQGPQLQSNNFGGFVAYTLLPLIAFFMVFVKDIRAWMVTPYFLLAFKVLLTTFSRGAYLAIAAGALLAGYYRGKLFLAALGFLSICLIALFPSIIPESIAARMGGLISTESSATSGPEDDKLDKSSSTRFVMWEAAGQMMIESPVLGKGFKGFPLLKEQYTNVEVEESDPHSMYFYLGSQMGIPALALFLSIMVYMFKLGRFHSLNKHDKFIQAVGVAGAAIPVCYAIINIFGSRAVALNFTIYFWAYLIVLQVFKKAANEDDIGPDKVATAKKESRSKRPRRNTAGVQPGLSSYAHADESMQAEPVPERKSRAGQRAPKRGAAAYMAQEAQRKDLKSQALLRITSRNAKQLDVDKSLTTQEIEQPQQPAYETRAVRRAREAAEAAAARGPRTRLRRR